MATNGALVIAGTDPNAKPLARPATDTTRTFEPQSLSEAHRLAEILVASRLLPKSVATPEAAFAIIATGRELGLTAMQSLRSIHVIEGKPTLSADLLAALVKQRADICEWFRLVESTDHVATYETQRRGEPGPTRMSFSMADAQRAGVTGKDNWRKYPSAMLRARCIASLARAVYPDLAMGLYDPDELEREPAQRGDYEVVRDETRQRHEPAREPVNSIAFAELCERVDACEANVGLNAIAKDAMVAARAGRISRGQLDQIAEVVKAKRAIFEAPSPASEPKVTEDGEEP